MKSLKTTITAVATAATLLTSGIVPTVTTAQAETVFAPGFVTPLTPPGPGLCATKPWLCAGGGTIVQPPAPPAPPPPAPAPGINPGAAAALGIVGGVIAGAALANAAKPKTIYVEPVGNPEAHSAWCHGKYKSYSDLDNTWLSYSGVRKPCISPYM